MLGLGGKEMLGDMAGFTPCQEQLRKPSGAPSLLLEGAGGVDRASPDPKRGVCLGLILVRTRH